MPLMGKTGLRHGVGILYGDILQADLYILTIPSSQDFCHSISPVAATVGKTTP